MVVVIKVYDSVNVVVPCPPENVTVGFNVNDIVKVNDGTTMTVVDRSGLNEIGPSGIDCEGIGDSCGDLNGDSMGDLNGDSKGDLNGVAGRVARIVRADGGLVNEAEL